MRVAVGSRCRTTEDLRSERGLSDCVTTTTQADEFPKYGFRKTALIKDTRHELEIQRDDIVIHQRVLAPSRPRTASSGRRVTEGDKRATAESDQQAAGSIGEEPSQPYL